MSRKYKQVRVSPYRILIVDDDNEYLEAMKGLLEREGHSVSLASNGAAVLEILRRCHFDLILMDYYMPHMTGEETVREIRKFNRNVQVIFQTGYVDEQPPRDIIRRLDIQGYYNKSDSPEQLLMWVDIGLKAATNINRIESGRKCLDYILRTAPSLQTIQPFSVLLENILFQFSGFLKTVNSFSTVLDNEIYAVCNESVNGFIALAEKNNCLTICAGTGIFSQKLGISTYLSKRRLACVMDALVSQKPVQEKDFTIFSLSIEKNKIGIVYLEAQLPETINHELLGILCHQASTAIYTARHNLFTPYDPLTKTYVRGIFLESLVHEIGVAYRTDTSVALVLLDIDGLGNINEKIGYMSGDSILQKTAEAIFEATSPMDIVGRTDDDEFAILLPASSIRHVREVLNKLYSILACITPEKDETNDKLSISAGACVISFELSVPHDSYKTRPLSFFYETSDQLRNKARGCLIEAKIAGGNRWNILDGEIVIV